MSLAVDLRVVFEASLVSSRNPICVENLAVIWFLLSEIKTLENLFFYDSLLTIVCISLQLGDNP